MSFLQPEKVPVKVYLSTNKDAPRLDRTPNCVATILKACLVTGYGDKEPAGWSLPFEDNDKGIKVLKPADSPHIPFFMRLSNDTGREMTVQVYQEMTGVDDGELKLQCDTPFRYGYGRMSGKWMVIASNRSVWFLFEQAYSSASQNKSGGYLFCGDTAKNMAGNRAVLLKHTGGRWSDGSGYDMFYTSTDGATAGKLLNDIGQVSTPVFESFFDSKTAKTDLHLLAPIYAYANQHYYPIPAVYACSNGASKNNFDNYVDKMVFGLSSYAGPSNNMLSNFYFDIETWVY